MAKKQSKMADSTWQRVRTGVMTAAMLKPVIDQVLQARNGKAPVVQPTSDNPWMELRARVEEQIAEAQMQIEKLAKKVTGSAQSLSNQAQMAAVQTLRKTDKRVWWASGLALGFGVAALFTFIFVRRRVQGQMNEETLIPLPDANGTGHHVTDEQLRNAVAQVKQRQNTVGGASTGTSTTATQAAPFIGNSRTLVYHKATSENLPAIENRVYFASETEAKAEGYRPAEGE